MGEEQPGAESAQRASSRQVMIAWKLDRKRGTVLKAFPGGGCLAIGVALTGHNLGRSSVHLPHILSESIEIAAGVMLVAAAIAVLVVLSLVPRCFWGAARNIGDQDM